MKRIDTPYIIPSRPGSQETVEVDLYDYLHGYADCLDNIASQMGSGEGYQFIHPNLQAFALMDARRSRRVLVAVFKDLGGEF